MVRVKHEIGVTYYNIGLYKKAIFELSKNLDIVRASKGERSIMVAIIYDLIANCWKQLREFDKAIDSGRRSTAIM